MMLGDVMLVLYDYDDVVCVMVVYVFEVFELGLYDMNYFFCVDVGFVV